MSESGATAAYRGYRLQAYYVLSRVLEEDEVETKVFHPEGSEDLNIENANGNLLEAIQVKSYDNLVLSNLSPEKSASFLHRALDLLKTNEHTRITLVNFGHFGPEIDEAWKRDGEHRDRVSQKLHEFGYKAEEIKLIFNHIRLVELSEEVVRAEVFSKLQEQIVGIDPANAFELLLYWLYLQSETQTRIKYTDLIEKLLSVGKFLNERYQHLQEWFKSIHPIDDRLISAEEGKSLQDEFYRGVSARYEHILANLDFHREQKLAEIGTSFANKNVVIIHAASGQGKTTLAYRFLHDKFQIIGEYRLSRLRIYNMPSALRQHLVGMQMQFKRRWPSILMYHQETPTGWIWSVNYQDILFLSC